VANRTSPLPEQLRPIYQGLGINIEEHNGQGQFDLPLAATFVVDSDGSIASAFVILGGMSANLCTESHMRELIEQGFEVAVVEDATAGVSAPTLS
jgi:hypothetical protein